MGQYTSIFQAEVHAIERCVQINLDRKYNKHSIAILSDSQAANKALSANIASSKLVRQCQKKLNELGKKNKVTGYLWTHIGVEGNEKADELARKGASTPFMGPTRTLLWYWVSKKAQQLYDEAHLTQKVYRSTQSLQTTLLLLLNRFKMLNNNKKGPKVNMQLNNTLNNKGRYSRL